MRTRTSRLLVSLLSGIAFFLACQSVATAATLHVGPERAITSIAEAARQARDGDTVVIDEGQYRGDVAVWTQRELTIRARGDGAILIADGESAERKAIWVFRNGNFRVENIRFHGARVPAGNGAGIRFEGKRLHLVDCVFTNNQMGLLTSNRGDSELIIENSIFADAPEQYDTLPHLLYAGRIARLELRGSRFHAGSRGHLVKSRARENDIRYNMIFDGPEGASSYQLEFPDGGDAVVIGNVIGQSAASRNRTVVAYGAEHSAWESNRLTLSHNTLVSAGDEPATFVRLWKARVPENTEVTTRNNLALGRGRLEERLPGDHRGNVVLSADELSAPELEDPTVPFTYPFRDTAAIVVEAAEQALQPVAAFTMPMGTVELTPPRTWLAGAVQSELADSR